MGMRAWLTFAFSRFTICSTAPRTIEEIWFTLFTITSGCIVFAVAKKRADEKNKKRKRVWCILCYVDALLSMCACVYKFPIGIDALVLTSRNTIGPYRRWGIARHDRCICIGRQQQNQTPHNSVLTLCSLWTIPDYRVVLVTFSPSTWSMHRPCAIYSHTISSVPPSILHPAHQLAFANDGRLPSHPLLSPSPLCVCKCQLVIHSLEKWI